MERIIVLGRDMDRLVKGKLDKEHSRVIIIPNWADLDSVVPASKDANLLLKELGLGQKFVVQYAGNMGRTHGLESLLDSAEALARDANVHFLFIGTGAKKPWIERLVRERKLTNVTVLGNRPRADQPNFLNACDVSIISFVPGMAGISVPSRMYNIMAAGKPIIAVADSCSEIALVVEEENIGWVVPPGQSDEISKVIKAAYSNPRLLMEMGQRAHLIAEKKYSIASVIDSYHELIKGICVCSD
jgi:glycosyltransferase involved in cell wall biosynthesis